MSLPLRRLATQFLPLSAKRWRNVADF